MNYFNAVTIILISILFITLIVTITRIPDFKYNFLINEKSIKITKNIENNKNSKNFSENRNLTCYSDLSGNYNKFINSFDIDKRLKRWFIEQTQNFNSINEVILGNDDTIQKVYYTHKDTIYGYKIDKKTQKEEYAFYKPIDISVQVFMDFIPFEQLNKLADILPTIVDRDDVVINFANKNTAKALYIDIPPFVIIKLNDSRLKQIIHILGFESQELTKFLDNNGDKYLSFIGFGKNNNHLSLYYLDEKNNKLKNTLNGF